MKATITAALLALTLLTACSNRPHRQIERICKKNPEYCQTKVDTVRVTVTVPELVVVDSVVVVRDTVRIETETGLVELVFNPDRSTVAVKAVAKEREVVEDVAVETGITVVPRPTRQQVRQDARTERAAIKASNRWWSGFAWGVAVAVILFLVGMFALWRWGNLLCGGGVSRPD